MKKILVPCDFSKQAKEAFKFALEIASISKGEVLVIYAIEMPLLYETTFGVQPFATDPELARKMEDQATEAFLQLEKSYRPSSPVVVNFRPLHDFVLPAVRNFIQQNEIDLVIMGTNGASGIAEFLIGSNTEKVVRFANVPVIAVRNFKPYASIKNIVFPTSLKLNQSDLVEHIVSLQKFFLAKIHIVYINTPETFKTDKEMHEALQEFVKHYKLNNYTTNFRNSFSERDGILNFANEIKADMITMATHGRKGLQHIFVGSIAESVVNHLGCLVWTYAIKS